MKATRILASIIVLCGSLLTLLAQARTDDSARNEIDAFLTAWHKAAAEADEELYFGSLAPDAVFLGTDATERWTKDELVKWAMPYFQRPSAWVFHAVSRNISLADDGRTAWFDELLHSESYWTCRGSGVLTKTPQGWKIRQYNLAFTIPNAVTGEIKPIVEKALGTTTPPSESER